MPDQEHPKISVIITTWNRAELLPRAVRSVLAQGFGDFELIIVDDGSTDDTAEVVRRFADPRIRYLDYEKNRGRIPALNIGVDAARGDFVAFLDSDDEWLPSFLERVMAIFAANPSLGAVYTRAGTRDRFGRLVTSYPFDLEGDIYPQALAQGYVSHMITIVVRRECFKTTGMFPPEIVVCEDNAFCLRLAKRYRFGLIREPLAVIHQDGGAERLIRNPRAYAEGWWRLVLRFEEDILRECGAKVLARHCMTAGHYFIHAGQRREAREAYRKARAAGGGLAAATCAALTALPLPLLATALTLRRRIPKALRRLVGREENKT